MRNDNKILNFGKIESLVDLQNLYTNNTIYDSFKKKIPYMISRSY